MIIDHNLIDSLLYGEEGLDLDFKLEQYKFIKGTDEEKSELLKDILAFANSWRRSDAFILIGVKEIKGNKNEVIGITEKLDDAQIQQFVISKIQRPLTFSYRNHSFEGKCVGIIHIPVQERPFFLKINFGKLKKGNVYIRRGSSTDIADPDEISKMGKSTNFKNLDLPILEVFFADRKNRMVLPDSNPITSLVLKTPRIEDIPDYSYKSNNNFIFEKPNHRYYRELTNFMIFYKLLTPINFAIKNIGASVARDVRLEIKIKDDKNIIKALDENIMPSVPESSFFPHNFNYPELDKEIPCDLTVKKISDYFLVEASVEKVQPKNIAWLKSRLFLGAIQSNDFFLETSIYSDDLPNPIIKNLFIKIESESKSVDLEAILELEKERFKNSPKYLELIKKYSEKT